jgi:hypothetical protein
MESKKQKKLKQLADKMLHNQDSVEALSSIKTSGTFRESISNFLDSHQADTSTADHIDKAKKIISLVSDNIKLAAGHSNFDIDDYVIDKKSLSDSLFLMQSFNGDINHNIYSNKNLEKMNVIYRKHSGINNLLT